MSAPVEHLATQSLRGSKEYDVVALGNLCVDVVVSFEEVCSLAIGAVCHAKYNTKATFRLCDCSTAVHAVLYTDTAVKCL